MPNSLVSILIPAYNRPHFLELALNSALKQTYRNIEIVICDDSTTDAVQRRVAPYAAKYKHVRYHKNPSRLFVKNWQRCLACSSGDYVNYLMDDDLYHPRKIEIMMAYLRDHPDVSLVTSTRQVIDVRNQPLQNLEAARLFERITTVGGIEFGDYMLTNGRNVVGEPTTPLIRRKDLREPFGVYHGRQFVFLNDASTWISLLSRGKIVFIPQHLSFFRLHAGQNQRSHALIAASFREWTDLILASRQDGFLKDPLLFRSALYTQAQNLKACLNEPIYREVHPQIRDVLQRIELLIRQSG